MFEQLKPKMLNPEVVGNYYIKANPADLPEYNDPDKRTLLLWSGGYDSSFILSYLATRAPLDVVSVAKPWSPLKNMAEDIARRDVMDYVVKNTEYGKDVGHYHLSEDVVPNLYLGENIAIEATSWMMSALLCFNKERHNSITIGYIGGAQISEELWRLREIWKHLSHISFGYSVPCLWPWASIPKESNMILTPDEIMERSWTCEDPVVSHSTIEPCGKCCPCIRHQNAIDALKVVHGMTVPTHRTIKLAKADSGK